MNGIDWQAYLDGSLSPEDRARAETALRESESARRELDGLRAFVGSVKEAALSERVPYDRLDALMPKSKPQRRWNWRIGAVGLAAAAVLVVAFIATRPKAYIHDESIETSDPVVAANWVQPMMPFKVPAIDLGEKLPLFRLHHGRDSCCFDYMAHGEVYHVNVLLHPRRQAGREVRLATGITAHQGRGVAWSQGNLAFFVVGPEPETALEVASATSQSLIGRA